MFELDDYRRDILHHIYVTGGYTNLYNLMKYLGINKSTAWHHLELLSTGNTKERYLKKVNSETRNSREKTIYQVTAKTCSLFDNPDSYFRKKHSREYIARSLLKNRYFSTHKELKRDAIILHDDKLQYAFDIGFERDMLPAKYVGENSIIAIEDTIIEAKEGLIILYFDKESVTVKRQVTSLFGTYSRMIKSNVKPIYLHIVTTNQYREFEYVKEIPQYTNQLYKDYEIDDNLIQLYASYNMGIAMKKGEDSSIISQNYKDGTLKNIILDKVRKSDSNLKESDMGQIREASPSGINGIIEKLKIMKESEAESTVLEYFFDLFRLNFHGYLTFHNKRAVANVEILSAKLF